MRKFKRLFQKAAIAIAIGTAGVSATTVPVVSNVMAAETDIMDSYRHKAKEFEQWAEDKGFEIELVDLERWDVYSIEEARESIQNFINAYDEQMDEAVEGPVYLYQLNLIYEPDESTAFKRTISIEDTDGNKIGEDVVQTEQKIGYTFVIDGTDITQNNTNPEDASKMEGWDSYNPEEIDGYQLKSTENIDLNSSPTQDETGKVVYEKITQENPGETNEFTITDEDSFDEALEKVKKYAQSKNITPEVVDLGTVEGSEESANAEMDRIKQMYKDMIDNNETPVLYEELIWWDISNYYERAISCVDEDDVPVANTPVQDVIIQRVARSFGSMRVNITKDGAKPTGESGITGEDVYWEAFEAPDLTDYGYEFVRGENIDRKVATPNEEGKCIYRKIEDSDKVNLPIVVKPNNLDESITQVESTFKEATKKLNDAFEALKESGLPYSIGEYDSEKEPMKPSEVIDSVNDLIDAIENYINNPMGNMVIDARKMETVDTGEVKFTRTISLKDTKGNKIGEDVVQAQNNGSQHGRASIDFDGDSLQALPSIRMTGTGTGEASIAKVSQVTPPEIDGYTYKSSNNTDEKILKADETGEIVYESNKETSDDDQPGGGTYDEVLEDVRNYAQEKGVEPKIVDLGETTVELDENGAPQGVDELIQEAIDMMQDAINNNEEPIIVIRNVSWSDEKQCSRTFDVVDEDGQPIDIEKPSQDVTVQKTGGYTKLTEDGEVSVSGRVGVPVKWGEMTPPEIDGYEFVSGENTEEKEAKQNETGKLVYRKKAQSTEDTTLSDVLKDIKNEANKNGIKLNETKTEETGKASEKDAKEQEYRDYYAGVLAQLRAAIERGDESFDITWKTFKGEADTTDVTVNRTITFEFQNETLSREPIVQSNTFTFSAPDVIIDTQNGLVGEDTSGNTLVVYPKVTAPDIDGWEFVSGENTDEIKIEYKATDDKDTVTGKVNNTGTLIYKRKAVTPTEPTDPVTPPSDPTPTDPVTPIDEPTDPVKKEPVTVTVSNASTYGLSESNFRKTFVRNVAFVFEDGTQAAPPVTQSITLERTALYDPNTGEIVYSNWNEGNFGEVKVPVIAGYEAGFDSIAATPVDVNSEVLDEIVTYYRTDEYVDNLGEVLEEAYIEDSYATPVEYLNELPEYGEYDEYGYETEYIGEVPDTGNPSAIGGIIGVIASGIGLTGASIFRRKKHEN